MSNEHAEMFKEEAYELLEELETALLDLEKDPGDMDVVGKVFRALHTIKGSGAMFGFEEISGFAHEVENVFDMVRNGTADVSKELIDLTLASGDVIKRMLDEGVGEKLKRQAAEIVTSLQYIIDGTEPEKIPVDQIELPPPQVETAPQPKPVEKPVPEEPLEDGLEKTYRIRFKPSIDILQKGSDVVSLLDELRRMGENKVVAHLDNIPDLDSAEPDGCYVYWDIILTASGGIDAIRDVFIFVEDDSEITVDVIDDGKSGEDLDYKKLGFILLDRGDINIEEMQKALSSQKRFGEILVEEGLIEADKIESALVEQEHVRELRSKRQKEETVSTLRVPSDKADRLVNLVGELVTLQARLGQLSDHMEDPELISISEEAERLVWDLRDSTMSIRMVPIGNSFSRFNRLVRDLSGQLQKDVELTARGGETELDKTIIERLNDPLVHIIRNCIDHAIEPPQERVRLGKEPRGKIELTASYSGANVLIVIRDDGAGIDANKIKEKAVQRGLIKPDAELAENEIFSLIFEPGFSTAQSVTSVSGRGVGMDVVKKNIDALRGNVQIESQLGKGTAITLKIPLTLAIIDGLLVRISEEHFILPLAVVEEIVELTAGDMERTHGRRFTNIRGHIIPYISLREQFQVEGDVPGIQQIVVVEVENRRVGFVVDQVIGKHQTVIKSLGKIYRDVGGLSGATILGDGTVALITDVSKLALLAELEEVAMHENKGVNAAGEK